MGKLKWIVGIIIILLIGIYVLPRLWIIPALSPNSAIGQIVGKVAKPPEVRVSDVNLEGIGLKGANLNLILNVRNQNPTSITIDRGEFEVYIDDDYVGRGSFPHRTISGNSNEYLETQTRLSWRGSLKGAWNWVKGRIIKSGSIMRIEGKIYTNVPVLGEIVVPFSHQKSI